MSTTVVTPPAAAARVQAAMPSSAALLVWTCTSTTPGRTSASPQSSSREACSSASGAARAAIRPSATPTCPGAGSRPGRAIRPRTARSKAPRAALSSVGNIWIGFPLPMEPSTESLSTDEKKVELTGGSLTVEDVVAVARGAARVEVSEEALQRVREARGVVERVLARGTPVYGTNTGLGSLARHRVPLEELERFSFATVADQTASYGEPMAPDIVRAMMVARANGMAKAGVGVRRELVLQLVAALNAGVHPLVRRLGSVGQGDLSEMSDIGKVLIGHGYAEVRGRMLPGRQALAEVGLEPISLAAKEALALVSANGVTLGHGSLVLVDAADLTDSLQIAAALSLEGFAGNLSPIHPAAARMRPHPGEIKASSRLRELLAGSRLWDPAAARNLQDPLSFRCVPQTHGALNDALSFARGEMDVELNSAGDNPLVVVEDEAIISVGSFDLVALGYQMVAHELICAAQAIDLRGGGKLGQGTGVAYECVRECVPRLVDETDWEPDVARLVDLIANGELAARVAADAGERERLETLEGPQVASDDGDERPA